ncbi:MAG: hypothetical protein MUP70_14075 [Candidatus Aminicenantes bacterium]|nr:hypothetical protein [Candidatus Aminicenantes bacterium]
MINTASTTPLSTQPSQPLLRIFNFREVGIGVFPEREVFSGTWKMIAHLKLTFMAERPPPPQRVQQELLMAAEEREEYF